jgi:uncharacterized protein
MNQAWSNKTTMVIGASSGLGNHLAAALAEQNARLILVARDQGRLESACVSLRTRFPSVEIDAFAADACDTLSMIQLARCVESQFGKLDLVIQAVGRSDRGTLGSLTPEHLLSLFQTNVISSLVATQHLAPLLKTDDQRMPGVLVLIGSLSSHFAPRFLGGYSIAKHGLAALAQQARLELADQGVHVLLASPGPISRTDAGSRYDQSMGASSVPIEALKSGGGAKLKGLNPQLLSREILHAAACRKRVLIRPRIARALMIIAAISPWLGDWLLRSKTS